MTQYHTFNEAEEKRIRGVLHWKIVILFLKIHMVHGTIQRKNGGKNIYVIYTVYTLHRLCRLLGLLLFYFTVIF